MSYMDIIARFQAQQAAANRANQIRYAQALKLYDQIVKQYEPGGGFGAGWEAQLGRQKTKDIAAGEQSLISSGLFGTTITAGMPKKWEEEIGTPARLKLEDIRMERLSGALQAKAGLIERREDIGPDYGMIAQMASQIGATPTYRQPEPQFAGGYGAGSPFGGSTVRPRGTVRGGSAYGESLRFKQKPIPSGAAQAATLSPSWYGPAPAVSQPTPAHTYQGPSGGYKPYGPISQPTVLTAPTMPFATPYALPSPFKYTPKPMKTW